MQETTNREPNDRDTRAELLQSKTLYFTVEKIFSNAFASGQNSQHIEKLNYTLVIYLQLYYPGTTFKYIF